MHKNDNAEVLNKYLQLLRLITRRKAACLCPSKLHLYRSLK